MNSSNTLYFYMQAGEVCGPVTVKTLGELYLAGKIEDGAICAEDNAVWMTYGEKFPAPKAAPKEAPKASSTMVQDKEQRVILTGLAVPFDQLIIFVLKLALASVVVSVIFAAAGFLIFMTLLFLGLASRS
jgi:ABC-type microcin C transport system permease subunit YejE